MSDCEKILRAASQSPNNLRFGDLCKLAECYGWRFKRQEGSHKIYEHSDLRPDQGRVMNFQNDKGKAKAYQVRQLLNAIKELNNDE